MEFDFMSPLALAKFEGKSEKEKVDLLLLIMCNFYEFDPSYGNQNFRFMMKVCLSNMNGGKEIVIRSNNTISVKILKRWNTIIRETKIKTEDDFAIMTIMQCDGEESFLVTFYTNTTDFEKIIVGENVTKDILHHIIYLGQDVHDAKIR